MSHASYIESIIRDSIAVKQQVLGTPSILAAIDTVAQVCVNAYKKGNKLLLAGNGGSAADAQHIAAELVARFEQDRRALPAFALTTDTSALTAISNDNGFEQVFARQVHAAGSSGDVFIGISTSGNSLNIIKAMQAAKEKGLVCVALCGSGGQLPALADYSLAVPSECTARIQECHIMIGHILCGVIEQAFLDVPN